MSGIGFKETVEGMGATITDPVEKPYVPMIEKAYSEGARWALCCVLDRLGADGVVCYLNELDVDTLSDEIYRHVLWLEDRARGER